MPSILQLTLFALVVSALAFLSMRLPRYKKIRMLDGGYSTVKLPNIFIAFLAMALLIVISGYRGYAFADTGSYTYMYSTFLEKGFFEAWNGSTESRAFWGIAGLIKQLTDADVTWFLMVYSILTILFVFIVFYKYSENFAMSVFLFITLGSYIVTMNAMRQCFASAIMFLGYGYLVKNKWIRFFILVAIAYYFHPTAIIMIPVYIFAQRRAWSPLLTAIMTVSVLVLAVFPSASNFVFGALGDLKYSKYDSMGGANIGRGVTMLVVCVLAFKNRERIKAIYPKSDPLINILLFHTVMLFAATNSWVFARLTVYTDLYVEILIPWIIYASFKESDRPVYVTLLLAFFLGYHLYEYRNLDYYSVTLGFNTYG